MSKMSFCFLHKARPVEILLMYTRQVSTTIFNASSCFTPWKVKELREKWNSHIVKQHHRRLSD